MVDSQTNTSQSLQDCLIISDSQLPLSEATVKHLLISLLSQLENWHKRDKTHGNLSPNNITVDNHLSKAFLPSVASQADLSTQQIGSILVTVPSFTAPEAARQAIPASDIYALGLIGIYWLTGKMPDDIEHNPETGRLLWYQTVNDVNPEFCQILDKAIEGDISDRYLNATEMLKALQPQEEQIITFIEQENDHLEINHNFPLGILIQLAIVLGVFGLGIYFFSPKTEEKPELPPVKQPSPSVISSPSQIPATNTPSPPQTQTSQTPKTPQASPSPTVQPETLKISPQPSPTPKLPPITPIKPEAVPPEPQYFDLGIKNKAWRSQMPPKSVVLTFDDGPSPEHTDKILDILRKHNIKATFFVVGERVEQNCEIIQRIIYDGHELGNHSYDHNYQRKDLSKNTLRWQKQQMEATQSAIYRCLEPWLAQTPYFSPSEFLPVWFRTPYAAQNRDTIKAAHQIGLSTALWSIDSKDWRKTSTSNAIIQQSTQTRGQDIIILHDGTEKGFNFQHPDAALTRDNTVQALDTIITRLKGQGMEFMTLSDAFYPNPQP